MRKALSRSHTPETWPQEKRATCPLLAKVDNDELALHSGFVDGLPNIVRRQRDIQGSDSQGSQRVENGIGNSGRSGYRASLTSSFHPQDIERTWCLGQGKLEGRQIFGKGDSIVHQGCAEYPPVRVVGHLFIKGLTDALSNGSMGLTLYQRGYKDITVIIYRDIAL